MNTNIKDILKFCRLFIIISFVLLFITSAISLGSTSPSYILSASSISSGFAPHMSSAGYSSSGGTDFYSSEKSLSSPSYSSDVGVYNPIFYIGPLGPVILSVDPASGYNTSSVHINKITGTGFTSGTTVKLSMTGETDISASAVNVGSATELSCDLNISGAKSGLWDVVVTKDSSESILPKGFEVKSYSYAASLALNDPNPFDPERETTAIMYKLSQDTNVDVYIFSTTGNLLFKNSFISGAAGGKTGDNSFSWNGTSGFGEMLSNGVYLIHIVDHSNNSTIAKGKIMILRRI